MSIISKQYFNEQIKPGITLLNLKDFAEVSIVEEESINKEKFQKGFIYSNKPQYDAILSNICEDLTVTLNNAIGELIIADMKNEEVMSGLIYEKNYFNDPNSKKEIFSNKLFELFNNLDTECAAITDGMRVRHVLCDALSFAHFKKCTLFESNSYYTDKGLMFDKQFALSTPLDTLRNAYCKILANKVLPAYQPALFILLAYSTEQALPVKLELTLPKQVEDKKFKAEYYYKATMVETNGLEACDVGAEVPVLKISPKKIRTFRLPILIRV